MKKKILATGLCGAMILSLIGCGGGSSDSNTAKETKTSETVEETIASTEEVALIESGYSAIENSVGVYIYYGIKLENKSQEKSAFLPTVTITAKNEDGSIITTEDQTLMNIAPGDTVTYGFQIDSKGTVPATVEFSVSDSKFVDPNDETIALSQLPVSNTSEVSGDFNISYTGEVENTSATDIDTGAATVLLRKDGAIVYGMTGFVNDLTASSKKPFEIKTYGDLPEHDSFEISVQPWL